MEDEKLYQEERFDSYINKIIILSSRYYFKKSVNISEKEKAIIDNMAFSNYLQSFIISDNRCQFLEDVDVNIELKYALNCLSDIEQTVIFLLFKNDLTQDEASKILEVYSKTISKVKIRAIEKLRKYMEGENSNEK